MASSRTCSPWEREEETQFFECHFNSWSTTQSSHLWQRGKKARCYHGVELWEGLTPHDGQCPSQNLSLNICKRSNVWYIDKVAEMSVHRTRKRGLWYCLFWVHQSIKLPIWSNLEPVLTILTRDCYNRNTKINRGISSKLNLEEKDNHWIQLINA